MPIICEQCLDVFSSKSYVNLCSNQDCIIYFIDFTYQPFLTLRKIHTDEYMYSLDEARYNVAICIFSGSAKYPFGGQYNYNIKVGRKQNLLPKVQEILKKIEYFNLLG